METIQQNVETETLSHGIEDETEMNHAKTKLDMHMTTAAYAHSFAAIYSR